MMPRDSWEALSWSLWLAAALCWASGVAGCLQ